MATRYYLCGFVRDADDIGWQPAIHDLIIANGLGYRALPAMKLKNGGVIDPDLCLVEAFDIPDAVHDAAVLDPKTSYLPFENSQGALRGRADALNTLSVSNRNAVLAALEAWHVPTDDINPSHTIQDLLNRFKRRAVLREEWTSDGVDDDIAEGLDENFSTVPAQKRANIMAKLNGRGRAMPNGQLVASGKVRDFLKAAMADRTDVF